MPGGNHAHEQKREVRCSGRNSTGRGKGAGRGTPHRSPSPPPSGDGPEPWSVFEPGEAGGGSVEPIITQLTPSARSMANSSLRTHRQNWEVWVKAPNVWLVRAGVPPPSKALTMFQEYQKYAVDRGGGGGSWTGHANVTSRRMKPHRNLKAASKVSAD